MKALYRLTWSLNSPQRALTTRRSRRLEQADIPLGAAVPRAGHRLRGPGLCDKEILPETAFIVAHSALTEKQKKV